MPIIGDTLVYDIPLKNKKKRLKGKELDIANLKWKIRFHKKCIAEARQKLQELEEDNKV